MKITTTVLSAAFSLLFVGCNALDRVGSQSVVFDSDPFTQIDGTQSDTGRAGNNYVASRQTSPTGQQPGLPGNLLAQGQTSQAGRVSVGNLGGPPPPAYNNNPQPPPSQQPTQMVAHAQYHSAPEAVTAASFATPPTQANYAAPPQPVASNSALATQGPAARAAAEAAAMMARRTQHQQPVQQPIQQAAYEAPASPSVEAYKAADFAPDPFTSLPSEPTVNAVPIPPEASYNPNTDLYELSDEDLAIPYVEHKQDPRLFPNTSIPIPAGHATMGGVLPSEWEPTPEPASAIAAQPVFSPPAQQTPVQLEPQPQSVQSVPVQVPVQSVPVAKPAPGIQDSTNQSKWRAVRRM